MTTDDPFKVVGIVSIGEMGLGIAKLLLAHKYRVLTFAEDRSEGTRQRAQFAGVELMPSIAELAQQCDCLLSIVPPRDAFATAKRVYEATTMEANTRTKPLFYLDLNAVSPSLAIKVDTLFSNHPSLTLIDGGIIGGVPYPKSSSGQSVGNPPDWHCPSLIVSGPIELPSTALCKILNIDHMSPRIGAATGLKMCFASTTKGFFALAIQSFVAADSLGVLPELRQYMERYNPATLKMSEKGIVTMPPKAYRWVHEMVEIATTMQEAGFQRELFEGVSEVYRVVAEDTELGKETPQNRVRGTTVEEAVKLIREGLQCKKINHE